MAGTSIKDVISDFSKLYKGLGTSRKIIIGAILGLAVSGLVYLTFLHDVTEYDYLFTKLQQNDLSEIVDTLKAKNIQYVLEENAVKVPRAKVHELRMLLAGQGLPTGEGVGFELFDNQKLGTSDFVQQLNLNRALQGELSRTISQLDKVETARVHLVTPKKALFKEDEVPSSASVVLKLRPGKTLEKAEIKSIVHLVGSAVEGLDVNNITIIDNNGKMLSQAMGAEEQIFGSSPLEYKAKVESELVRRVEEMVSHVVGVGKVVAKVTAELDFKQETKTEEMYDPDQVVVRSEKRIKENRNNSENGAGGAVGAQSNTPEGPQGTKGAASTSNQERDLINYEINKVVRHTVHAAGDIRRINIAVLVDGSYTEETVDGKTVETYHERSADEMANIRELVKRAVGFDATRGDAVEVVNVAFNSTPMDESELQLSFLETYDFIPQLLRYGIILILAIGMVFFLFRPLVTWIIKFHEEEQLREIESAQDDVVKSMEEQLVEVRRTIEISTTEYKQRLTQVADQAPELVAAVLRNWVAAED
jgi:flagellar M-ring protein FliF